jgi:hypothetical protein
MLPQVLLVAACLHYHVAAAMRVLQQQQLRLVP